MALMTNLRDKTHLVLYTLLAAFLALIVFEWGMNFNGTSGGGGALAGKVNGTPIQYQAYEQVYDNLVDNFRRSSPDADITDQLERQLRRRAWDIMVDRVLLDELLQRYGISVSDEEVLAAVEGPNPPMIIRQNFTDSQTGEFDRERFEEARMAPENSDVWVQVEEIIRREMMVRKLERVLATTVAVTEEELGDLLERELAAYRAAFLTVPYAAAGPDSLFTVTDAAIEDYYRDHRERFRQEPSRSLSYVFFPAVPTTRDSMSVKTELAGLASAFAEAGDDSSFVSLQSDRPGAFDKRYTRADFSPAAAEAVFGDALPDPGSVIGPVADRGTYRLIKVHGSGRGDKVARASHILLRFDSEASGSRSSAERQAGELMQQLASGASFADLARTYSDDTASAGNGGDLGWFDEGDMVPAFEQAVFSTSAGKVTGPVESPFGFHIIKVTGRDDRFITCSEVVRDIRPSGNTLEQVRRTAAVFQIDAEDNGFGNAVERQNLEPVETGPFTRDDAVPGIGFNNQVTRFAFEASKGKISDVLQVDDGFLVMMLDAVNASGYRELDEELSRQIRSVLVDEQKGEALEERLAGLRETHQGDLEAIAAELDGATVTTRDSLRLNGPATVDPFLLQAMTGLSSGQVSRPVRTADGRGLVALQSKSWPGDPDLDEQKSIYRLLLRNAKTEQLLQDYFAALRASADIEDMRRL